MDSVKKNIEVALLAFISNDKVLLNRRADADSEMWEFIGGGVENGETPQDAIQREILEEVGYPVSQKKIDYSLWEIYRLKTIESSQKSIFLRLNFLALNISLTVTKHLSRTLSFLT